MSLRCFSTGENAGTPIEIVAVANYTKWLEKQTTALQQQLKTQAFCAKESAYCALWGSDGGLDKILLCIASPNVYSLADLPLTLPEGDYHIVDIEQQLANTAVEIGWGLGAYQFTEYKKATRAAAKLAIRTGQDKATLENTLQAIYRTRDLINLSAEQMTTEALATAAQDVAKLYGAKTKIIVGDKLLKHNFPTIHAVGRASVHEPRLIDLRWGNAGDKKITLVGKGVCFDTGGYDIKSAGGMIGMKKDMGGAAHVLGLAAMIMAAKLPVNLRVLIPAVENSIAGNAYRPSDVITTRKGLTVEVGNTDAEGRLILCDALAYAAEEKPDLLIDIATLTGAAKVALGSEVPVFFTDQKAHAQRLYALAEQHDDPVWQLPLYKPYQELLASSVADVNNMSNQPWGGAITAALFLQRFVKDVENWQHWDIMAANVKSRPGRPEGADAQGLRTLFAFVVDFIK